MFISYPIYTHLFIYISLSLSFSLYIYIYSFISLIYIYIYILIFLSHYQLFYLFFLSSSLSLSVNIYIYIYIYIYISFPLSLVSLPPPQSNSASVFSPEMSTDFRTQLIMQYFAVMNQICKILLSNVASSFILGFTLEFQETIPSKCYHNRIFKVQKHTHIKKISLILSWVFLTIFPSFILIVFTFFSFGKNSPWWYWCFCLGRSEGF